MYHLHWSVSRKYCQVEDQIASLDNKTQQNSWYPTDTITDQHLMRRGPCSNWRKVGRSAGVWVHVAWVSNMSDVRCHQRCLFGAVYRHIGCKEETKIDLNHHNLRVYVDRPLTMPEIAMHLNRLPRDSLKLSAHFLPPVSSMFATHRKILSIWCVAQCLTDLSHSLYTNDALDCQVRNIDLLLGICVCPR